MNGFEVIFLMLLAVPVMMVLFLVVEIVCGILDGITNVILELLP